jgi:lipoprotein signal peptidase
VVCVWWCVWNVCGGVCACVWCGVWCVVVCVHMCVMVCMVCVVVFLDFRIWPVFNAADSAITCGMVLLFFYFIKNSRS